MNGIERAGHSAKLLSFADFLELHICKSREGLLRIPDLQQWKELLLYMTLTLNVLCMQIVAKSLIVYNSWKSCVVSKRRKKLSPKKYWLWKRSLWSSEPNLMNTISKSISFWLNRIMYK